MGDSTRDGQDYREQTRGRHIQVSFGGGRRCIFEAGKPKRHGYAEGFIMVTGEVQLADGSRYWALLEICEEDSGEHYGTGIVTPGGLAFQDEENFLQELGKTREEVFPYKYRSLVQIPGDIHVDPVTGWSLH